MSAGKTHEHHFFCCASLLRPHLIPELVTLILSCIYAGPCFKSEYTYAYQLKLKEQRSPCGIAVSRNQRIFVADSSRKVLIFSSSGSSISSFVSEHFKNPKGIAFDHQENILVTDRMSILKFTQDGSFISKFGENHLRGTPRAITVSPVGQIFVADYENHRIVSFDSNSNFTHAFGGTFHLSSPVGITCSSDQLLVADTGSHRIQIFDFYGNFLRKFDDLGLRFPCFLAVDCLGSIAVADQSNHLVVLISKEGKRIGEFGGSGREDGQFYCPTGIAVNGRGTLFVTDLSSRIQVFQ